jgi:RNase H-fold protein (predicted Holliday junction resolvase)
MFIKIFNLYYIDPKLVSVIGVDIEAKKIGIQFKEGQGVVAVPSSVYESFGMSTEQALDHIASEINKALEF